MMIGKYTIAARTLALIAAIIALVVLAMWVPSCIQKQRSAAAQARTDAAQAGAAQNSAADAIGTVARSGEAEAASEAMTRNNERDIRAADGANDKVKAGADTAGRRALCRRIAYAKDPKCKVFSQ